jgi:DNA-directed RNA polymerase specialized sigma24 family protein
MAADSSKERPVSDLDRFEELVRNFLAKRRRLVQRSLVRKFRISEADAEDALAIALERIWRMAFHPEKGRLGFVPEKGTFDAYVFVVARSVVLDSLRRRRNQEVLLGRLVEHLTADPPREGSDVDEKPAGRFVTFWRWFHKLPSWQQLVLRSESYREYEEWSRPNGRELSPNAFRVNRSRLKRAATEKLATA